MRTEKHPQAVGAANGGRRKAVSISSLADATLTAGQQQARDLLLPIFQGKQAGARACIEGYAGTGKTFLTARLIAEAFVSIPGARGERNSWGRWDTPPTVLICGPTHKACRQIERALAAYGVEDVVAATLHSALGIRPRRIEDREVFEVDPRARQLIDGSTRLVVVDEASMVGRDLARLLWGELPEGASLVAIGDPAQLQPVGDPTRSPLFDQPIQARLSEVVRHQGPILQLATATRELGNGRPRFVASTSSSSAVISHEHFGPWRQAAIRCCRQAAQEGNIDGARVLAWTNGAVAKFNGDLHRILYGPSAPPYVVGQPVVSHSAITGPDGLPLVSSTCEMELLAVEPAAGAIDGDELLEVREALLGKRRTKAGEKLPPWQWWNIEAQLSGEGRRIQFQVLDPEQQSDWSKAAKVIANLAKGEAFLHGKAAARDLWGLYWARKDRFGRINPVWALTIHKSQGSTFDRVFLHPDLDRHHDQGERNQLAYVGITRAAKALHVIADPPPPPTDQDPAAAVLAGGVA
jgi:exodeoxyribonuclease V